MAWARGPTQTTTDVYFVEFDVPASLPDRFVETEAAAILAFPNPFTDQVRIEWTGSAVDGEVGVDLGGDLSLLARTHADVPIGRPATLEVFDVRGRRVDQILDLPSGPGSVIWPRQTGEPQAFPVGSYWMRIVGIDGSATVVRLTRIR